MDNKLKEIKNIDVVERRKTMYAATVEEALSDTGESRLQYSLNQ